MILDCPQCTARFLVADTLIPEEGRMVRCGACANQWFVEKPVGATPFAAEMEEALREEPAILAEEEPLLRRSVGTRSNVPALTQKKRAGRALTLVAPALALTWLVLALVTYFPHWINQPVMGGLYRGAGVVSTEGVRFSDIKMDREQGEVRTKFIFSGNIVNHAPVKRLVPIVHVSLNGKDGRALWGRDYPVKLTLKPGEVYPFQIANVETSFAQNVSSITLDLGNSLELAFR